MKYEYIGDQSITIHGNGESGARMSEIELPKPAAWLVTGGRTYHDKAFVSKDVAETSISERRDGARLDGLFTAEQVRSAILAERERCARVADSKAADIARVNTYRGKVNSVSQHVVDMVEDVAAAIRRGSV